MSASLQKYLNERRQFGTTPFTERSKFSTGKRKSFDEKVYSDSFIMSQMTLERELPGHTGCVNTLDWSQMGDKLLTGSDDTKLNIYKPFEDYKISTVINSGHRANIFSAKFMPKTSDNVIISGAGDSEIRIFDLQNMESPLFSMYVCHKDQVKRICVFEDNPNEFLTCSQDGTVRHFDLRVPHICSPHNVRSFLTAQLKPARQFPLPQGDDIHQGCSKPIVDYSKFNIELNTITINQAYPHYFAVAGMNDYIYMHDRRMLMPSSTSAAAPSNTASMENTLKCIKRFSPTLDGISRPNKHITACKFSENGQELIGSWSSDGIYLFNVNDTTVESSIHKNKGLIPTNAPKSKRRRHHNSDTAEVDASASAVNTSDSTTAVTVTDRNESTIDNKKIILLWNKVTHYYTRNDLSTASIYNHNLLAYLESIQLNTDTVQQQQEEGDQLQSTKEIVDLGKACCDMVNASILTNQVYNNNTGSSSNSAIIINEDEIKNLLTRAESIAPPGWQGMWMKAIGYWILGGGVYNNGCSLRELYLDQSLQYTQQAKAALNRILQPPHSSTAAAPTPHQIYSNMIDSFLQDLDIVRMLEGYIENTRNISMDDLQQAQRYNEHYQYNWIRFMYVTPVITDVTDLQLSLSMAGLLRPSSSASPPSSSLSPPIHHDTATMAMTTTSDADGDAIMQDSSSTPTETDTSDDDEDEEEEEEEEDDDTMAEEVNTSTSNISEARRDMLFTELLLESYRQISGAAAANVDIVEISTSSADDDSDDNNDDDDEEDDDDDYEAYRILRDNRSSQRLFNIDVGVVKPKSKYTGHCNIETVKDVDFYGPQDEYIVSGSDGGYLFIWDKKTTKIVQILQADEEVVNVAKGHPYLPILAVSGIDSTVKIFKPTSRPLKTSKLLEPNNPNSYSTSSHLYEQDEIISTNRENSSSLTNDIFMTRNMYAAFLNMQRQRRLFFLNGIIDENEIEALRRAALVDDDEDDLAEEPVEEDSGDIDDE